MFVFIFENFIHLAASSFYFFQIFLLLAEAVKID